MTRITAASLAKATPETSPTLLDALPRFRRHLAAENKSARTIKSYAESVERLHEFLASAGMPVRVAAITREHVEAFVADQLERLKPSSSPIGGVGGRDGPYRVRLVLHRVEVDDPHRRLTSASSTRSADSA
jgi:integrase-like protein